MVIIFTQHAIIIKVAFHAAYQDDIVVRYDDTSQSCQTSTSCIYWMILWVVFLFSVFYFQFGFQGVLFSVWVSGVVFFDFRFENVLFIGFRFPPKDLHIDLHQTWQAIFSMHLRL